MTRRFPHALITGGSSGIGLATACRLAAAGHAVSIIARTPATLAAAVAAIEAARRTPDPPVLSLSADVSDRTQAESAVRAAMAAHGPPDLLITSAGVAIPGRFAEVDADVFERTMAVNYFGSLWCVRSALPAMRRARRGRIVLVSSGAGLIGMFGYSPYAPTKFALRGLAESLRGEVGPDGIGVSIVYPPDTDTPQLAAENRTKPEETRRMTATARSWTADGVAACIVRGAARGRFAICPGWEMAALYRLHSLVGPLLQAHFDRLARAVARERGRAAASSEEGIRA